MPHAYIENPRHKITRDEIKRNPNTIYVFGDNIIGEGYGGQAAEARGEFNTIGIPTKHTPTNEPDAFIYDDQFDMVVGYIDGSFERIMLFLREGHNIVFFPNIGRGFARMQETAPRTLQYIEQKIEKVLVMSDRMQPDPSPELRRQMRFGN